jgi:hypothetical protein
MAMTAIEEARLLCQSISESNREFDEQSQNYFITLLLLNAGGSQLSHIGDGGHIGRLVLISDQRSEPFVYKGVIVHRTRWENGFMKATLEVHNPDPKPPIPQALAT